MSRSRHTGAELRDKKDLESSHAVENTNIADFLFSRAGLITVCSQLLNISSSIKYPDLLRYLEGNKTDISYLKTSQVFFLHKSFN